RHADGDGADARDLARGWSRVARYLVASRVSLLAERGDRCVDFAGAPVRRRGTPLLDAGDQRAATVEEAGVRDALLIDHPLAEATERGAIGREHLGFAIAREVVGHPLAAGRNQGG